MAYSPAPGEIQRLRTLSEIVQGWAHVPVVTLFGFSVIFLAAFFNMVDFNEGKEVVALDRQVAIKLVICAGCALYGGLGFCFDSRVRKRLLGFPGLWLSIIVGFYFLSVLTSIDMKYSLASTMCLAAIVSATVTALVKLGVLPVLNTLFWACGLFVLASWAAFVFVPELGVFSEPLEGGEFFQRMGGLAHPNTLGQFSGVTILLGVVLHVTYGVRSRLRGLLILAAAGALVLSVSRAAGGATILALAIAYRHRFLRRELAFRYLMVATAGLIVVFLAGMVFDLGAFVEARLLTLSKSGDAEELTTITGRSEIWAYTLRLIAERPLTGYGAATSKLLLEDYSFYTHNLVLNVALSTGIFGGLAALLMCGSRFAQMFWRRHPAGDAIVAFICIAGLVENVIFSPIAAMPTMVWTVGLVWWSLDSDPAVVAPDRARKTFESLSP
jgi:O-antigen ligase